MYRWTAVVTLALVACPQPEDTGEDTHTGDTEDTSVVNPTDHCGEITTSETWAAGVHDVTCDLYVEGATLTLAPGVEVRFAPDLGLYVGYNGGGGQLIAEGTPDDPIRLHGPALSGRGTWTGVIIKPAASESRLAELTIEDAGGMYTDAALFVDDVDVRVNNVTFNHVEDAGFRLIHGARFSDGSAGLVVTDAPIPGWIEAASADSIPLVGLSLADNDDPELFVDGGDIDHDATWSALDVPYFVQGDLYVEGTTTAATLTLGAGTELVMGANNGIYVGYNDGPGGFVTAGTEALPVVLRGTSEQRGLWTGVRYLDSTVDADATLTWTEIADAGGMYSESAVYVEAATLKVDHVTLRGAENAGFQLGVNAKFDAASTELVVTGCEVAGDVRLSGVASIPEAGDYVGNDLDAVTIDGDSTLDKSATWGDLGVPYVLETDIEVGSATGPTPVLTLEAGVELAFGNSLGLYVGNGDPGGLIANGTTIAPVVFTGAAQQAGAWSGIFFKPDVIDASAVLTNVDIGYAGGMYSEANVTIDGSSPTLSHAFIHHSENWGIVVTSGSPVFDQVTYLSNASGDLND